MFISLKTLRLESFPFIHLNTLLMASLTFSSISRSLPQSAMMARVSDKSSSRKDIGFSLGKRDFGLTVTNVATPQRPVIAVPLPPEKEKYSVERNHVAWTSVRQERWEGELVVQGEIPLWLVIFAILLVYEWIFMQFTVTYNHLLWKPIKIHSTLHVIRTWLIYFNNSKLNAWLQKEFLRACVFQ